LAAAQEDDFIFGSKTVLMISFRWKRDDASLSDDDPAKNPFAVFRQLGHSFISA
jgi:hypothetical protein